MARAAQDLVTLRELAMLTGYTPSRVSKFIAEGMPVAKTGGGRGKKTELELGPALRWLLQRKTGSMDVERTRYFRVQADAVEQKIRHNAGELVEVTDVERRWAGVVVAVREKLLALPGVALQQGLIPSTAEDAVIQLVDDILSELATRGTS